MKTKQQLLIDNLIAKPMAFLLNFLVRLLGQILNIDHNLHKDLDCIVVCKFKGMGSIIQATPLLDALRQQHPNAEIIFVSTNANTAILKRIDTIDTIYTINDKGIFSLLKSLSITLLRLMKKRPDVYIDLEIYSNFSTLVTLFSLAKNRVGYYLRSSSFKMGIYTHMMYFNTKIPVSESYLQIARLFGKDFKPTSLYPLAKGIENSYIPPKSGKYIVINPNASDLRLERRWGRKNYKFLIEQILLQYPDYTIYLVGSPNERPYTEKVIAGIINDRLINLAGKTSINELISLVKGAAFMVTNDTGPMHISFAVNTATIALFGPCSPDQYGHFSNAKIIFKDVFCSPCVHEFSISPCKGNNTCMQLIEVSEVLKAVQEVHENGQFPLRKNEVLEGMKYEHGDAILGLVRR